jgi:hypothetical protein
MKFNLDDLYVRFFRIAERRIVEGQPGRGVVSYISNYSYLEDPSFVVMRKRLSEEFDAMWFDNMNGDSRATGKRTPDGRPDPSVFSTEYHSVGIKVGTTIATLVRTSPRRQAPTVCYRDFWGISKRQDLLESLAGGINPDYLTALPSSENKFSFRPSKASHQYLAWPTIAELAMRDPINGPIERRGNSMIAFSSAEATMTGLQAYLNKELNDDQVTAVDNRLTRSSGEYDYASTRRALRGKVSYDPNHLTRYPFKPFDVRVAYLDASLQPLFSRPSPRLLAQGHVSGQLYFLSRDTADKNPEGPPCYMSRFACDYDFISGHTRHFPIMWRDESVQPGNDVDCLNFDQTKPHDRVVANLSNKARAYLTSLGIADVDENIEAAEIIWLHALAIGYSPAYLTENADGIRQDWPRIPLPATRTLLQSSAALGKTVAALLDTETPVDGVSTGTVRPELRCMGMLQVSPRHILDLAAGDLGIAAGWGHGGKDRVTMPGKGRLTSRDYSGPELEAIEAGAAAVGATLDDALALLGDQTHDVWLNDVTFWQNVPVNVWNYVIGGYQVIKKWLSYREKTVLGRDLTTDEARYVTEMVRRLSALILLQPQLDENYHATKESLWHQ